MLNSNKRPDHGQYSYFDFPLDTCRNITHYMSTHFVSFLCTFLLYNSAWCWSCLWSSTSPSYMPYSDMISVAWERFKFRCSIHQLHREFCLLPKHEVKGGEPCGRVDTCVACHADWSYIVFPTLRVDFRTSCQILQECPVPLLHQPIWLRVVGCHSHFLYSQDLANFCYEEWLELMALVWVKLLLGGIVAEYLTNLSAAVVASWFAIEIVSTQWVK